MLNLTLVQGVTPPDLVRARRVHDWCDESGRPYATSWSSGPHRWIEWPGLGIFGFAAGSRTVRAWPDHGVPLTRLKQVVLEKLQPVILQALGWQALHAAAVASPGGVLALCGTSGSGKSTIANALSRLSFEQLADDGLVLDVGPGSVVVEPVPFRPNLREDARAHLGGNGFNHGRSRRTVSGPRRLAGVCILRQVEDAADMCLASRVEPRSAFARLVTHAHCFDTDDVEDRKQFANDYLVVASLVPVFELQYRPDLRHLNRVVAQVASVARRSGIDAETAAQRTIGA